MKGLRSHMTQRQSCRDAVRRVAEKREPIQCTESKPTVPDQQGEDYEMEDDYIPNVLDPEQQELDPPWASNTATSQQTSNAEIPDHDRRARVEEVDDEEDGGIRRWIEDYPQPAGSAGMSAQTYFENLLEEQRAKGQDAWAPFEDEEEWGLAQWLMLNVGQNATDKFLKLPIVSSRTIAHNQTWWLICTDQTRNRTRPSFKNKRTFYKKIDTLPRVAKWLCEPFEIEGDQLDETGNKRKEILHLWKRDPIECIRELIGNPAFRKKMCFAPERVYEDLEGKNRIFDEMWTGDWWWNLQVSY
jgi:Plavaka transposase